MEKTNALRIIEKQKISCTTHSYPWEHGMTGMDIARLLHQNPGQVLKTLVTVAKSGQHYVFMVPVAAGLDLKKAAAFVDEKSIQMVKDKELLPLTGYIHGGCSPIGMKKLFPTVLHQTALQYDRILFSAGKPGWQVELAPADLKRLVPLQTADIITQDE